MKGQDFPPIPLTRASRNQNGKLPRHQENIAWCLGVLVVNSLPKRVQETQQIQISARSHRFSGFFDS